MKTPRGSTFTKELEDKIVQFGKSLNLEVEKDAGRNIMIRKPATKGKENSPSICLQAHLDMV